MSAAVLPPRAASPDHLDDLFNYDAGIDETFAETNTSTQNQTSEGRNGPSRPSAFNLDEEVVVTRKRAPVAKLDEARLSSPAGITKLRKVSKSLKFKGKSHEFSDMSRLLTTYQIWLDELFPKAKFVDGLTMIEKLGHKKTMQMMRRGWIDEGRPRPEYEEAPETPPPAQDGVVESSEKQCPPSTATEQRDAQQAAPAMAATHDDQPPEDDLDALLAEEEARPQSNARERTPVKSTSFEDDEEAMAEMGW